MVAINDNYMNTKLRPDHSRIEGRKSSFNNLSEFSSASKNADVAESKAPLTVLNSSTNDLPGESTKIEGQELPTYHDMPLLISDHDGEDSEGEIIDGAKNISNKEYEQLNRSLSATQEVKKSIKEERIADSPIPKTMPERTKNNSTNPDSQQQAQLDGESQGCNALISISESKAKPSMLSIEAFNCERSRVMKIVVKYVAMKITNSFPPQSSRNIDSDEMPLDEFLMILISRLQLSLPLFMKGIIYLFRYMDIIYLLRYVNQSNNFANYTDMGYGLKKLIIGCYRLVLARERKTKDWSSITGLKNAQINDIVRTVVGRLNGKLLIKPIELVRLRSEIFRFVTMVTKTVESM